MVRPARPLDCAHRAPLDCVRQWFSSEGWEPFPFQEEVWQSYLAGESGLIHAATGTGKTYAAWLGAVLEWLTDYPAQRSLPRATERGGGGAGTRPRVDGQQRRGAAPLRVLWTPRQLTSKRYVPSPAFPIRSKSVSVGSTALTPKNCGGTAADAADGTTIARIASGRLRRSVRRRGV